MNQYLLNLGFDFKKITFQLPKALEKIVHADFLTDNDCIILKGHYGHNINPIFATDLEKCYWEYDETHFHPNDYALQAKNELIYLKYALSSAKRLYNRLEKDFKEKKFRIIVSFYETVILNGEIEAYGSSTVRFYQIRDACDHNIRTEDLECFKSDAILELET
jgi:hypothetical protein